ncbi:MAG: alpha/beta hydrolase [Oleiphilaceae bacterium]|nr:alpha/beta hydrolase [Oleiphilaceae bacterium]
MPVTKASLHLSALWVLALSLALLTACTSPSERYQGPGDTSPRLEPERVIAHDGYALKLHRWTLDEPRAVVLALHGFNDYGAAFSVLAEPFNEQGISLYAYDQRGFGASEPRGYWPGHDRMARDAATTARLLRARYPRQPLYLMGESMGGAVALLALQREDMPELAGSLLLAPAVWGHDTMPWYQRFGLWLGSRLAPGLYLPNDLGSSLGIDIEPSDDREMLQALAEDPMVQQGARIGTLEGLTSLMDVALSASEQLTGPALILYGDNDQIIPPPPVCRMLEGLPDQEAANWRMSLYPGGYHMLTRYSESGQVIRDMLAWLGHGTDTTLPSGHEVNRQEAVDALCD